MPLSQIHHVQDYHDVSGHLSNRTTPSSEPDNRASGGLRKRVPVAVCFKYPTRLFFGPADST